MIFTILESRKEEVVKKLSSLQKKAEKYNNSAFTFSVSESYVKSIPYYKIDYINCVQYKDKNINVFVCDIEISENALVRYGNYEVIAKIEHAETGNIVTIFNEENNGLFNSLLHKKPYCEHCKTNHARKNTFIVKNESELKQIGSACLKDYCGIDVQSILYRNEIIAFCEEEEKAISTYGINNPVYSVSEIVARAIEEIKKNGYRKSDSENSTKTEVYKAIRKESEISEEAKAKAEKYIDYILKNENNINDSFMLNCLSIIKQKYIKASYIGYLCYFPVSVSKMIEKETAKAEERNEKSASEYIGNVNEKITFSVKSACLKTSFTGYYGTTFVYEITDKSGNVFVWYTSKGNEEVKAETIKEMKATVKEHKLYNGIKQTIIKNAKAI